MFKAFTDNISSFIGSTSSDKNEEDRNSTGGKSETSTECASKKVGCETGSTIADGTGSGVTSKDNTATGGIVPGQDDTAANSRNDDESSGSFVTHKSTKVPPPRPNPPLTPASSINKHDDEISIDSRESIQQSSTTVAQEAESSGAGGDSTGDDSGKKDRIDEKLDEVAGKAKEWGSA